MPPVDPKVVESLFEALLALEKPRRAAELRRRAGGDAALEREVASLLEADEAAGDFLEATTALRELAREVELDLERAESPDPLAPGSVVGAWRLIEVIGSGGMGRVWRASRAVGGFEQQAALKVVRVSSEQSDMVARFAQERQTLAGLEHPSIARLLDGGATPDGRPFLAMELIDGERIDEYCRKRELPLDARLRLFEKVCRAVEHAHQRLVVHRDLKPANILVNGEGEPKLLDFGIAKLLAREPRQGEVDITDEAARRFTVEYASPEQLSGAPITTASDIYSLGLILYELLTDARAFELRGKQLTEVVRLVCHTDPLPPSAREALPPARRRRLRGDLDAILLKALRKEPERRYATVAELREDLERHRQSLPVRAAGDTTRYLVGRFVRRHRFEVGFALLTVLSLAVALAVSLFQTQRANQLATRLGTELDQRGQALQFFAQVLGAADRMIGKGPHTTLGEILDAASTRLIEKRSFAPEVEYSLRDTLGLSWLGVDEVERAVDQFERALARLDAAAVPADDTRRLETGRRLLVARITITRGEERRALLKELEELVERYAVVFGPTDRHTIYARCDLAVTFANVGLANKALPLAREVEAYLSGDHDVPLDSWVRLSAPVTLANALFGCGEVEAALPIVRAGYLDLEKSCGESHDYTLDAMHTYAAIESQLGHHDVAEPLFRELIARRERYFGANSREALRAKGDLAIVYARQGKHEQAYELFVQVLAAQHDAAGELTGDGTVTLGNTINSLRCLGRYDEAVERVAEYEAASLLHFERNGLPDGYRCLIAGVTYLEAQQHEEALPRLEEAYRIFGDIEGADGGQARETAAYLRRLHDELGDAAEAERWGKLSQAPGGDG
ncbi:MAG: serine/threonine protein kinase [Planctomycetes bacterium]|nr:serine/threonine protein kinase [Planctomycetota bacterium]